MVGFDIHIDFRPVPITQAISEPGGQIELATEAIFIAALRGALAQVDELS